MNGIFFGGLFWGILISLIGISIVLKYAFHIEFPFVRIFFGIIIILIGFRLILGHTGKSYSKTRTYAKNQILAANNDVVFSSATIDLSSIEEEKQLPSEISVVFGSAVVIIPDTLNLEVFSTTVFGTTMLPDRTYAGFGEDRYLIQNIPDVKVHRIQVTTVFGKLVFKRNQKSTDNKKDFSSDSSSTENSF